MSISSANVLCSPPIEELHVARRLPELAVLSAAAHGRDDSAADLALTAIGACAALDTRRATRYADFILASLSEAARLHLETLMSQQGYQYQSEFARKYFQQGRDEGHQKGLDEGRKEGLDEGRKEVLLLQLAQRFGDPPAAVRQRIEDASADQLRRWAERIISAPSIEDIFGDT